MKKTAKSLIVSILGWQVKRLLDKNDVKVIAVVGSIGKTSTKFAIARVLGESMRVRFQEGNYNDTVTVPLVFFGHQLPPLLNVLSWSKIVLQNEIQIHKTYPYDVVVVEIGTDGPGQVALFKKYLRSDYAVVTAITAEHMEYFTDLDAVAAEELSIASMTETVIANADLCDSRYLKAVKNPVYTYAEKAPSNYRLTDIQFSTSAARFSISSEKWSIKASMHAVSRAEVYSASAAAIIAHMMGVADQNITEGIAKLQAVPGRMQLLHGIKDSLIIDETYNASPDAVLAALQVLYEYDAPQRIALLGNMNELGTHSEQAHTQIGQFCDPDKVELVVTLGTDANKYTAAAARQKGCTVIETTTPYKAAEIITEHLESGAVMLAKGSQNGVFAEEAVKQLLSSSADRSKLVRQSPQWLKKKAKQFNVSVGDIT